MNEILPSSTQMGSEPGQFFPHLGGRIPRCGRNPELKPLVEAIERTRIEVVFATGIPGEICRRIGPGTPDPASVQIGDCDGKPVAESPQPGGGTM
jgi:hypothetical protein